MEELGSSSDAITIAKKHIYAQNYQEAIECLQQVIEQDGTNIESYNLLAYAMKNDLEHTSDGFQKAIDIMQKALEIQPNNTLTLFNLASTCYEMEDFIQAIGYYTTLIQQNKVNDYRVFYNLAMSYEKQGETSAALEHYQQSIKLNPNFSSSTINYSNLLMQLGKQTQAKYVLENYLKNNKGDMRALNNLNILLAEKQIDQKVEDNFKKINQSGAITSVYNNGVFLSKQGKLQEALTVFKGLTDRLQEDLEEPLLLLSHVNQGVLYEKMGEYDTAIAKYHFILGLFGDQINSDEFYQRIGELKHKTKDKTRFIPQINKPNMNQTAQQWNRVNKQNNVSKQNNFMGKTPETEKKKLVPITQKSVERKNNTYQMREQQKGPSANNSQTSQFDEHQSSIEQISMVQPAPGEFHKQSTLGTNSQKSNKVAPRNPRSGKMSPKRIRDASLHDEYEKQFPFVDEKKQELSTPSRRSSAEQVLDQLSIKQRTETNNYRKIKPQTPKQVLVNQQQLQLVDQDPSIQSQVVQSTQKQFMRQSLEQQQMQPVVKVPIAPKQETKEQKFFKNEEQNKNRQDIDQKLLTQKQSEQHQQQSKDIIQSQTTRQQAPILTQEALSQRPDSGTYRKLNIKPQTPKMQLVQSSQPADLTSQIKPQLSQEQNKFIQDQQKALKEPSKVIKQSQPNSNQQSQEIKNQSEKEVNQQQQQISPGISQNQPAQIQRQQEQIQQNTPREVEKKEIDLLKEKGGPLIKEDSQESQVKVVQEQQKQPQQQAHISQTNQVSNKAQEQVISDSQPQKSSQVQQINQLFIENQDAKQLEPNPLSHEHKEQEETKQIQKNVSEPTSIHMKEENQYLSEFQHLTAPEVYLPQTQQYIHQKEAEKSSFSEQNKIEQLNEEQELKQLIIQDLSQQVKQIPNPMGDSDSEKNIVPQEPQDLPEQHSEALQEPQGQTQLSPKLQRKSEPRFELLELPRPVSSASKRKESIKEIKNDEGIEKQKSSSRSIRRPDPMKSSQKQQNDQARIDKQLQKQGSIPRGNYQDLQQIPSTRVVIPQVTTPEAIIKIDDIPKQKDSEIEHNKGSILEQEDQQLQKQTQIQTKQEQTEKSVKSQQKLQQRKPSYEQQLVKQEQHQAALPQQQPVENQIQTQEQSLDKQSAAIVKSLSLSQEEQIQKQQTGSNEQGTNNRLAETKIHSEIKEAQIQDQQVQESERIMAQPKKNQQPSEKNIAIIVELSKTEPQLDQQTSNHTEQLYSEQLNKHQISHLYQLQDKAHEVPNTFQQSEPIVKQQEIQAQQHEEVTQKTTPIESEYHSKPAQNIQEQELEQPVEEKEYQKQHSIKQFEEVGDQQPNDNHIKQDLNTNNAEQTESHEQQIKKELMNKQVDHQEKENIPDQEAKHEQINEQQVIPPQEVQSQENSNRSGEQLPHQASIDIKDKNIVQEPFAQLLEHKIGNEMENQTQQNVGIQEIEKKEVKNQNNDECQEHQVLHNIHEVQEQQNTQQEAKVLQEIEQQQFPQEYQAELNPELQTQDQQQSINRSLHEEKLLDNQPQDENCNQEVQEHEQQPVVVDQVEKPIVEQDQNEQNEKENQPEVRVEQEQVIEQVLDPPIKAQELNNNDQVDIDVSCQQGPAEIQQQNNDNQQPMLVDQQDQMKLELEQEQGEKPKVEVLIVVEQGQMDVDQDIKQQPVSKQTEIHQQNQQEQERNKDKEQMLEQPHEVDQNKLEDQIDNQDVPVQIALDNTQNQVEHQVDHQQVEVPEVEVLKADESQEVKDLNQDQQFNQIPIPEQHNKIDDEQKNEDKQIEELGALVPDQNPNQNVEVDEKQQIIQQQNDSQAQDSASLINDNSKAELKPEDQLKNDQPLDLEDENNSEQKLEILPNQEQKVNDQNESNNDPIKGLSKIPVQPQYSNEEHQQDEINELAEVLIIPDGPKQQLQNQGSLDSNNFSSILNKGDTQNLDGDPKNKKQPIKVIKYPEDFETWSEEICKQLLEDDPNNIFAVFKLALIYIDRGQVKEAKERLVRVNEIDALFEIEKVNWALGEVYEQENEWSKSLQSFRVLYPYTTEKYNCLMKIGRCYKKLDEYDRAEKTYKRAIDISNKDYQAYYKLAQMQIESGNLKDGVDNLVKAQSLNTDNIEMIIKLSEAYMMYDEDSSAIDDAIAMLHKGLLLDPLNFDCTQTLAKAYEKKGDLVSAINFAKKATEQPNSVLDSYFYLGTLYMKKKDLKSAADSFRTLLKQNSEHVQALIEYGTIASIQGNYEKAKKYLKHALQFDSKNTVANLRLGRIYQTKFKDMIPQAIECFMRVVRADPTSFKSHFYIGQCYLEKKDFIKANEQMNQALKINPKFGLAHKALASLYYEKNQPAKALKYFQKAIECESSDLEAKIGLANCYYLQESFEQAIELYEEISRQDQNEELEYNLANCYYMKSQYEECVEHYLRALKLNPNKTECYYNLGNTYCIQEKFEEALQCFEQTIKNDPKHSAAIYNYANTYFVLQDYDSAAKYFEQAIELEPNNIEWKNYVANLYMEKGDLSAAKYHLDESLKLNSTNADTYVRYASYYYQIGNYKDTIKMAKIALSHDETNAEALALIKELTK